MTENKKSVQHFCRLGKDVHTKKKKRRQIKMLSEATTCPYEHKECGTFKKTEK